MNGGVTRKDWAGLFDPPPGDRGVAVCESQAARLVPNLGPSRTNMGGIVTLWLIRFQRPEPDQPGESDFHPRSDFDASGDLDPKHGIAHLHCHSAPSTAVRIERSQAYGPVGLCSGLTRQPQRRTNRLEYRELMVHPEYAIPVKDRELLHNCASSREAPLA